MSSSSHDVQKGVVQHINLSQLMHLSPSDPFPSLSLSIYPSLSYSSPAAVVGISADKYPLTHANEARVSPYVRVSSAQMDLRALSRATCSSQRLN